MPVSAQCAQFKRCALVISVHPCWHITLLLTKLLHATRYIVISDGTELCTTVNDSGVRMYMDWDSLEWKELPSSWMSKKAKRDFQRGSTHVRIHVKIYLLHVCLAQYLCPALCHVSQHAIVPLIQHDLHLY